MDLIFLLVYVRLNISHVLCYGWYWAANHTTKCMLLTYYMFPSYHNQINVYKAEQSRAEQHNRNQHILSIKQLAKVKRKKTQFWNLAIPANSINHMKNTIDFVKSIQLEMLRWWRLTNMCVYLRLRLFFIKKIKYSNEHCTLPVPYSEMQANASKNAESKIITFKLISIEKYQCARDWFFSMFCRGVFFAHFFCFHTALKNWMKKTLKMIRCIAV